MSRLEPHNRPVRWFLSLVTPRDESSGQIRNAGWILRQLDLVAPSARSTRSSR